MNLKPMKFAWKALLVTLVLLLPAHSRAQDANVSVNDFKMTPVAANPSATEAIALSVPKRTAVQVVLDNELQIQKVAQPGRGRVPDAIYAFHKLAMPVGIA